MITKKPLFAGKLYPNSLKALEEDIISSFNEDLGPGETPSIRKEKKIFGAIVPHSKYEESGQCAAWAYKEIAEGKPAETYIIVGPNHNGVGPEFSTYLFANWETPFGIFNIDKSLGLKLNSLFSKMRNETTAHSDEHSVEVQLPFLQYANLDKIKEIKFVPVVVSCSDYKDCRRLGECIAEASEGKQVCLVASSDFVKHGSVLGISGSDIKSKDEKVFEFIRKMDGKSFLNHIFENNLEMCGASAITIVMEACKVLGAKQGRLLQYYTSLDIKKGSEKIKGYCSFVFE